MDTLYGKPYKSKMSASINELGLDKTLDTYNDETRMVKELLLSDSKIDYMLGLALLQGYFSDGGHTALNYESNEYRSDTVLGKATAESGKIRLVRKGQQLGERHDLLRQRRRYPCICF